MTSRTVSKQLVTPGISIHTLPGQGLPEGSDGKLGPAAQLFHSSKGLIVLDQVLRSAKGGSVDPPSVGPHPQVSDDESILSLPRAMEHHGAPTIGPGQHTHLQRLRCRANLVRFEREAAARQLTDSLGNPFSAGYCEINLNHVDACLAVHFGQLPSRSGQRGSRWTPLDTPR